MQTLDDATTVIDLEQLVNGDDCKCQSAHAGVEIGRCTHKVVGRKTHCEGAINICQASYDWNMAKLADDWTICTGCKQHPSECWTVYPI